MRIISGTHKSRIINMVNVDTTRETTDKVRGAIFNLISDYAFCGNVLDLFSGSAAMGLEALSRGCCFAYFNDINRRAYQVGKDNAKRLGVSSKTCFTNLDYRVALKRYDVKFKFIFLDPPYKLLCCNEIIEYIYENNLLLDNGLIICEVDKEEKINEYKDFVIYKDKEYGIRRIVILKKA